MALDLLKYNSHGFNCVGADYLVARLCEEAGVCVDDGKIQGNNTCIANATWERGQGLLVTDADGRVFRLKVTAEEVKP